MNRRKLRVKDAYQKDTGTEIIRMNPDFAEELSLKEGDVIEIKTVNVQRKIAGILNFCTEKDDGVDIIRLGPSMRKCLKVSIEKILYLGTEKDHNNFSRFITIRKLQPIHTAKRLLQFRKFGVPPYTQDLKDEEVFRILSARYRKMEFTDRLKNLFSDFSPFIEFKVNDYITLILQYGQIYIYVKGRDRILNLVEIEINREVNQSGNFEEVFWDHCSHLQLWAEHNYDTNLLKHNLAFPLLKSLTEAGDPKAKRVLPEEIIKRLKSRQSSVIDYLIKGDYLRYIEDITEDIAEDIIKNLSQEKRELFFSHYLSPKFWGQLIPKREKHEKYDILIIHADPVPIRLLTSYYGSYGIIFRGVQSGAKGLEQLQDSLPRLLILLDIMLHDINGYNLCKTIKSKYKEIPVYFLTTAPEREVKKRFPDSGADGYIGLPFEFSDFNILLTKTALAKFAGKNQEIEEFLLEKKKILKYLMATD